MKLSRHPDLLKFFSTWIAEGDAEDDAQAAARFAESQGADRRQAVASQARALLADRELPLDELGSEANRWFGDDAEARAWLEGLLGALDAASEAASGVIVKDCNGALLAEGDSVMVIKDLPVKGGSSDLKRGTMIRKIHLVDDSEVIECRVDGSTLVLKTCFLKKA